MKTTFKKTVLLLTIALSATMLVSAQALKINPKNSVITIQGKSNLHDWESKAQQVTGQIVVNLSAKQVQSMFVDVPVKSIKSGEKLMDTKTYEAFNIEKNPNIQFKMTEVNNLQINESNISATIAGNLTMAMAGVTKKVAFKVVGKPVKGGSYQFTGSLALKMTDFKMAPPTAMMGMLKVGDGITLKFDVTVDGVQLSSL